MSVSTAGLFVLGFTGLVVVALWTVNRMLDARSADSRRRNHARQPLLTKLDLALLAFAIIVMAVVASQAR